jgi:hypothetical protein
MTTPNLCVFTFSTSRNNKHVARMTKMVGNYTVYFVVLMFNTIIAEQAWLCPCPCPCICIVDIGFFKQGTSDLQQLSNDVQCRTYT